MQACMFLLSAHIRSFLSSFSNIIVINLFFIIIIIIIIMMIIFYLLSLSFARVRWKSIRFQSDFNPIEIGLISRVLPFVQKMHLSLHTFSSFSHYSLFFALFSFHLRLVFVFQSKSKRSSIEVKAKFYRSQSEGKAKFYRTSIEHLSKTYRRSIEDLSKIYRRPIEDLSKRACVNCFIHLHKVCLLRMGKSPCIFLLTIDFSVRIFKESL